MSGFRAAGRAAADLFIDGLDLAARLLMPSDIDARAARAAEEQRMRLADHEAENEVSEPAQPWDRWPAIKRGDLVAVKLSDGTIITGAFNPDLPGGIDTTQAGPLASASHPIGTFRSGLISAIPDTSARLDPPGAAEERPAPATPDAGAGPTLHTDAELITAAANQVDVLRRLMTNPTQIQNCAFHVEYLDELIPQLRDLAAQFEATP